MNKFFQLNIFVGNWDDETKAVQLANRMMDNGVDIIYPAGDGFNVPVIYNFHKKLAAQQHGQPIFSSITAQ